MGYLNCPICEKTELSNVQELQQKIATALSKSHSCPICSAEVYGLQAMHLHLAIHIPIEMGAFTEKLYSTEAPTRSAPATKLTLLDHIPSLERLDIQDDRYSPRTLVPQSSTSVLINANASSTEILEVTKNESTIQYNCDLCGLVFWSDHFLSLHKDIIHSKNKVFEVTCKQCKSRFKNLDAYREHVREAHSDRRYICDQCPKSFKVKGGLLVHTRMYHDQSSPSTCAMCRKNFISKARKELHDRRYHPANVSTYAPCIGETKTLLANLLHPTSCSDNNLKGHVNKFSGHQKLERHTSSPAVLIQNKLVDIDECKDVPSAANNLMLVKDVEMKAKAGNRDFNDKANNLSHNNPSQFGNKERSDHEENSLIFANKTIFPNSDIKVSGTIPITPCSIAKISTIQKSDATAGINVYSNSIGGQRLLDNLKPLPNFEADMKNTCMQLTTVTPNGMLHRLPFTINYNKKYWENVGSTSGIVSSDNSSSCCERNFSFLQENVQKQSIVQHIESLSKDNYRFDPIAENSPENSVRQVKEALEELLVESPVSSPNEGLLQGTEKILSPGEILSHQTPSDLLTKKIFPANRTSENKQWECEDCKKSFTTKYFLKKHKRLHTGETPYCCLECGKNFTFQQSYHKHVLYHSDDKPHICPHCGRAFKEMSTLHNHIRIHTGEKPFTCLTCGKSFRQRVSYLVHQRIHTGQMPYHCDNCNRSFRYKVSLRSHKCECGDTYEISNLVSPDTRRSHDSEKFNIFKLNLASKENDAACKDNQTQVTKITEGSLSSAMPTEESLQNQLFATSDFPVVPNSRIGLPLLLSNSALHACEIDFSNSSNKELNSMGEPCERVDLDKNNYSSHISENKHLNANINYLHAVICSSSVNQDNGMEIFQCVERGNIDKQSLQTRSDNLMNLTCVANAHDVIYDCSTLKPFESLKNKEPHYTYWCENESHARTDLQTNYNEKEPINKIKFEGEKIYKNYLKDAHPYSNEVSSINSGSSQLHCRNDDDDDQETFLKSLFS